MTYPRKQRGDTITAYLLVVLLACVCAMVWLHYSGKLDESERLRKSAEGTLKTERTLREGADKSVASLQVTLDKQKGIANENRRKLLEALASPKSGSCTLSGDVGRVLRDQSSEAPTAAPATRAGEAAAQGDPAGTGGAGAGADAQAEGSRPVSCAAIAIWAQRNIDEVLKPNAAQLSELQGLYEQARKTLERQGTTN